MMATTDLLLNTQLALVCYCVILAIPVTPCWCCWGWKSGWSCPWCWRFNTGRISLTVEWNRLYTVDCSCLKPGTWPVSQSVLNMSQSDHHKYADEMMIDDCRVKCIISICWEYSEYSENTQRAIKISERTFVHSISHICHFFHTDTV